MQDLVKGNILRLTLIVLAKKKPQKQLKKQNLTAIGNDTEDPLLVLNLLIYG